MFKPTAFMLFRCALAGLTFAAGALHVASAWAAATDPYLRERVEIDAPRVLLGDLFDNAGTLADIEVMSAPLPGEKIRLSIKQAFEIANENGLGWRPVAPFEYTTVTRAWRTVDHAELLAVIERSLARAGARGDLTVDAPSPALNIKVARGAIADLAAENTVFDQDTGHFRTTLVVRDGSGQARRTQIFGRAFAHIEVPVLRARFGRDHVIDDGDIQWRSFRAGQVPDGAIRDPLMMIGMSPSRTVTPGKPVQESDLKPPTIVRKGSIVAMQLVTERMQLVATGRALGPGALGDVIQVQNTQSHLVVDAVVTGHERVAVRPASLSIEAR